MSDRLIFKNAWKLLKFFILIIRFQDLKSGLNYLKENVGSKTANSSDNLLKTNISSFMDAIKIMKGNEFTNWKERPIFLSIYKLYLDIHSLSSADKRNDFSKTLENMLKGINIDFF